MNVFLKKQNFLWRNIAVGLVALALFIFILNIFQSPIKNTFYVLTSPLSKMLWKVGDNVSGFFGSFFNAGGLLQENSNLKQENQNLLSQIASLQDTAKQDQAIKEVIQNTQANSFKMVLAQTIGLGANSDILLMSKGSQDGIAQNMPVMTSTKVLVGKVLKVYKNFSQVVLVSNKQSVVDVKILTLDPKMTPILGAIRGGGNLAVYLDLIPSDAKINPGDTLLSSGQEGIFPKDLLIGKITSVDQNDLKPFQTAQVKSLVDAKNMDNLFVITDYKKEK